MTLHVKVDFINPFRVRLETVLPPAELAAINLKLDAIMSAISEFTTQVNDKFNQIGTSLDGLGGDIAALKAKIDELQNSSGVITPEDQALLDDIQAKAGALADRVSALDALTEPVSPPQP